MSLPSDPEVAKLRIYLRRAQDAERAARVILDGAKTQYAEASNEVTRLRSAIHFRYNALGYCDICECPLTDCPGHAWAAY